MSKVELLTKVEKEEVLEWVDDKLELVGVRKTGALLLVRLGLNLNNICYRHRCMRLKRLDKRIDRAKAKFDKLNSKKMKVLDKIESMETNMDFGLRNIKDVLETKEEESK